MLTITLCTRQQKRHWCIDQSYGLCGRGRGWGGKKKKKKAEHWRTDAFELWCWRRLLRVPWTARRSNQSILKISFLGVHWKDWGWSWNSNTMAIWCEELTHWKRYWCWERLKVEKVTTEDEMVGWHHRLDTHEFGWTLGVGDGQGGLARCDSWGHKESDTTEQLNWTWKYGLPCRVPYKTGLV